VPIVFKSGSLILLEISGPVQACNGIALPLPFYDVVDIAVMVLLSAVNSIKVYQRQPLIKITLTRKNRASYI
jgi:hypothetical protein